MSTQKQRHTKARRDRARIYHRLVPKVLVACSNCGAKIEPHRICSECGRYKGKEVVDTMKKVHKKSKK